MKTLTEVVHFDSIGGDDELYVLPEVECFYDYAEAKFARIIKQVKNKNVIRDYLDFLAKERT